MSVNLTQLSAFEVRELFSSGKISPTQLLSACLDRCTARDRKIGAWACLDPENALNQAKQCDSHNKRALSNRPLHGLPIGIKDIFDTSDLPTEYGSRVFLGHQPRYDSKVVKLLKKAGAIIVGKTITTEFALSAPAKTRNPLAYSQTPGGSSSGSAAAVADLMVPLSIGSQTGGSVLRPASYCGIYGFKPSFDKISCEGMMRLAERLDHVGIFARHLKDIALVSDVLIKTEQTTQSNSIFPNHSISKALDTPLPRKPRLAFIKGIPWQKTESYMNDLCHHWTRSLECSVDCLKLNEPFDSALDCHTTILNANLYYNFKYLLKKYPKKFNLITKKRILAGKGISASTYISALEKTNLIEKEARKLFTKFDALITASAPGEPPSLETTGSSVMQQTWTLLGNPCFSLPVLTGPNKLPVGIQIIGARGNDKFLFRVARWLMDRTRFDP